MYRSGDYIEVSGKWAIGRGEFRKISFIGLIVISKDYNYLVYGPKRSEEFIKGQQKFFIQDIANIAPSIINKQFSLYHVFKHEIFNLKTIRDFYGQIQHF